MGQRSKVMTHTRIMRTRIAFVTAAIALFSASPEGRAQTQGPIPPPLSTAQAKYFKNNPAAWSQFLAQLPPRPAGLPGPTQNPPPPTFGGSWTAVTTAPVGSLSNPLLLTDGTVIVH